MVVTKPLHNETKLKHSSCVPRLLAHMKWEHLFSDESDPNYNVTSARTPFRVTS